MRSPYRIRPFLAALEAVWQAHPDYRFGQLVMNLSRTEEGFADTWEWEDSEWLRRMNEYEQHPIESWELIPLPAENRSLLARIEENKEPQKRRAQEARYALLRVRTLLEELAERYP